MAEYKGVSGALYTNNYKSSENQPDYTGEVDLSKEVIDAIRQQMESKVPTDIPCGLGKRGQERSILFCQSKSYPNKEKGRKR